MKTINIILLLFISILCFCCAGTHSVTVLPENRYIIKISGPTEMFGLIDYVSYDKRIDELSKPLCAKGYKIISIDSGLSLQSDMMMTRVKSYLIECIR